MRISWTRRVAGSSRRSRRTPSLDVAQAPGRAMFLDCQRYMGWWFGVVKLREATDVRVVHVCTQLRGSPRAALHDAEHDAQTLALMFAQ